MVEAEAEGTKVSLQLLFVRHKKTFGYIHMDVHRDECALWGIHVDKKLRGLGLSKVFVGIWVLLCLRLGLRPKALKIDKPLVSLVLQSFGFVPKSKKNEMHVILDTAAKSTSTRKSGYGTKTAQSCIAGFPSAT